jgi:peptidoglycan/LPS O-acetylase OafA/YrhL
MTKTVDLDPRDNDASFTLNLLRILAAEMVCGFHAIALFNVSWLRLPHVPPMQNFGVCIFFVLSGFLIAHTLARKSEKPTYGFREYAIERIARIYSGWIPALIFVVVVDAVLIHAGVYDPQRHFDLKTFVGNFFMFQEYNGLFSNHLSFRMFGSGAPFWTMSVEFHIYLLVGAVFFFLRGGARWWLLLPVILIFSQQPASNLTGTSLFTLWLSGFAAAFVLANYAEAVSSLAWLVLGLFSGAILILNIASNHDPFDPTNYIWVATCFTALVALALRSHFFVGWKKLSKVVQFMADYSFSLYLTHYTVLYAASKFLTPGRFRMAAAMIIAANVVAILIALPTEMRHRSVARWMKSWFLPGPMVGETDAKPLKASSV